MVNSFIRTINKFLKRTGTQLTKTERKLLADTGFPKEDEIIWDVVKPYTMTSFERIMSLLNAVEYIVKNDIKGDIIECGVWKGGSIYAVLLKLMQMKSFNRKIYLFDTFEGMSAPTIFDVDIHNNDASERFRAEKLSDDSSDWCNSPIEFVQKILRNSGYPMENIIFVKGKVEDTLPYNEIHQIALLRLDTDWYESTRHEMEHLFPLLVKSGVLILDDYGHWHGAKKAVDEYIEKNRIILLLNRIDYTGRIAIKSV